MPPVELLERRTKTAKHYRNDDATFTGEFSGGAIHYQAIPGGPWLDKRQRFTVGPGTDEWVSLESDVSVRTYKEAAKWWVEFTETLTGAGIRFELPSKPTVQAGSNRINFLRGNETWSYYHTRTGGKLLGPPTSAPQGLKTLTFTYELLGGAPPLLFHPKPGEVVGVNI
jgi:hypothetical protein